jgi:DNA-binding CsgD family transcriptional regulator
MDGQIQLIERGGPFASLRTIAEVLGVYPETIRFHLSRIG